MLLLLTVLSDALGRVELQPLKANVRDNSPNDILLAKVIALMYIKKSKLLEVSF